MGKYLLHGSGGGDGWVGTMSIINWSRAMPTGMMVPKIPLRLGLAKFLHIVYLLCDFLLHLGRGAQESLIFPHQPKSPVRPNKKQHCSIFFSSFLCSAFPVEGVALAFLKVKSLHDSAPLNFTVRGWQVWGSLSWACYPFSAAGKKMILNLKSQN